MVVELRYPCSIKKLKLQMPVDMANAASVNFISVIRWLGDLIRSDLIRLDQLQHAQYIL